MSGTNAAFAEAFRVLKQAFAGVADQLILRTDTAEEYKLASKVASPFPQHKGHPMDFGSVRVGKAYVSVHLLPIYMHPVLNKAISDGLKKRMQGKSCFNFKTRPSPGFLQS